jgi:Natural resistance-associated macrophage protein
LRGGASEIERITLDTSVGIEHHPFFIILTTAAVLNAGGITNIHSAAEALRPLAGDLTFVLFALGIVGTGLLAVPARRFGCVLRFRGVRLARHPGSESAGCHWILQHHCRRHGRRTRARVCANRSHPNAGLERRAQWHCRRSDHDGHDGGRYAPFNRSETKGP